MNIKNYLRRYFIVEIFINKIHEIEGRILPILISDEKAVKRYYKKVTGEDLDLNNPKTFCEKTNWYKLYGKNPLMAQCADKVGVREYISNCGYSENLNEIYGVYNNIKDINLMELPSQFVLKAAHGTHMNIIVKNKEDINWKNTYKLMNSWLHQDIYWWGREWVYKDIPHRIIAEKYLEDETGELRDYKVFCFNGKPKLIQIHTGRQTKKHLIKYYDIKWNDLKIGANAEDSEYDMFGKILIEKPKKLNEILEIATNLAKPFQFARIDFYIVKDKVYIGELTFFNAGGSTIFKPDKWNKIIGDYWSLVKDYD